MSVFSSRASHRSLMFILLWLLIPALVVMMILTLWISNNALKSQVDMAYDRFLAGALKLVDVNLTTDNGGILMEQPFLMLELFELTADGRVHYRVSTEDGTTEIGDSTIPLPAQPLVTGKPIFYEAEVLGEKVRVAALARKIDPTFTSNPDLRVIIQVAENIEPRDAFIRVVVLNALGRDVAAFVVGILLVIASVYFALRPLDQLYEQIEKRDADDLSPINDHGLPKELLPIVRATNLHMQRYAEQARIQRQFLDDASHQLRTPLSVLKTQISYALRENDINEMRVALFAMQDGIDQATRMTNQMLSLARAQDAMQMEHGTGRVTTDINVLAEQALRHVYPMARERHIDLGVEMSEFPLIVLGQDLLIREALFNLLDNAISYSPEYGCVTLHTGSNEDRVFIRIQDSGPGIKAEEIPHAGKRFWRGEAGKMAKGAGLGLAIVQAIMKWHGGKMEISTRHDAVGLNVTLWFKHFSRINPNSDN